MGKEDYGPISQYNSLTDPYLQGYFSKNIIRSHLRQSGLISRKGDIIPEEVWRKRIATKQKMQQASRLIASKIVQQAIELKNLEQAEFRRKLDDVAKKELVRRIRGQSAQTRELPLLWPNNRGYSEERLPTRSRSRSPKVYEEATFIEDSQSLVNDRHRQYRRTGQKLGSNRLSSKKRLTKLNRGYALLPKPEPTPVMVTMYYYGKSINIPFDTQVFEYRDEIAIYQQHCGGENLLVYSGLHQAGDKFEFRSKRHKEYPFSLTIYINSTYDCRISTCCEYKHQLNVKIGGKGGKFAITNVTGSEPCIKCLLEKSEKEAKRKRERDAKQKEEEKRVDDIEVDPEQPTNSRKNSDQEATEIEVKHEEDKDQSYDDEWNKGDDQHEEESHAESSKSEPEKSILSIVEEEINKIKIPVKHEEDDATDVSSSESKAKSPTQSKRKSSASSNGSVKDQPNRYSSNDVIDIIEKEADAKRSASRTSKKSTTDNTSEDESKLESVREKTKSPSQKSSKASSRAGSAKSKISDSGSISDDSDTDKLLNRIRSGRTNQSKAPSPTKSKTPSQKGSRNASPAGSVVKSPTLKSPKGSKPSTPVEKDEAESEKRSRDASPAQAKSPSQKGSRNSSPARSLNKSPSLKSPKGSKPSSPTKNASKPSSPVEVDKPSRRSSARSQKSLEDETLRSRKSASPSKSPVQKEPLFSDNDDTKDSSDLVDSDEKGEIDQLKTKPSEYPQSETNNVVDVTNSRNSPTKNSNSSPDLVKSPNGSRQSLKQHTERPASSESKKSDAKVQSPKQLSRAGSSASKRSSRPPSENEKSDEKANVRPASSESKKSDARAESPKQLSRAGSSASKKSSRPPSENEKSTEKADERPPSSGSKKSSRRSSKSSQTAEKPPVPQVNIIPSSDVEKSSNASFNDETKWYKDEDVQP